MSDSILSNRYKILQKLGEGGFGQAFLAQDLHLPTKPRCVVKRLKPEFDSQEMYQLARRLFEQEAEMLYRLGNHPHIPNLLAHLEVNGEFFLVQELIEGWTLADEFKSGKRYNEREAVDLTRQILETLAYVHSENVIHRDIKPTNLIRRKTDGQIFLIDFGAVKQVSVNPHNQSPTFKSTIAIGSNGYMPSEQTAGKPRFASDLYGTGLVVIESLTGINPLQLVQNRVTDEFVWQHKGRISQEFGNFISRLVRYDFRQRYHSAREAVLALNLIAPKFNGAGNAPNFVQPIQLPIAPMQVLPPIIKPQESQIIPPTASVSPNYQPTMVQIPRSNSENFPRNESKGLLSSFWNNDFALGGAIVVAVLGFFFVMGYILVSQSGANSKADVESSNAVSGKPSENKASNIFYEAKNQADEAEEKEKRATTKRDWDEIGNQYKRAYTLLTSIGQTSSDYEKAQEKMTEYQQKSEIAYQKGAEVTDNPPIIANSNSANYPTTVSTTSTTSTPYINPTPTPMPKVTMPGKQSYQTYLSYNILNYNRIENKVITTNDAIFTTSVEKQSQNMRDSGVVRIKLEGGSYSSASLEFKAPQGQRLTSGNYSNAQEYGWQSPTMYAVSFDKLHCFERGNHSFTINSIIYDDLYASIAYIDASFTINCDTRRVMGRVRYDAR